MTTMTAASVLDELDVEISLAYTALCGARQRFLRCPSGENADRCAEAQAEVDLLLDRRLAATRVKR